ncbi:MAG: hypothetical protein AAFN59_01325 [Pseudomonadota bacterium]
MGKRSSDTAQLEAAVAAYEAALEERTQDRVPLDWAMTQNNRANVEVAFFDLTKDDAHLDRAARHLQAARDVFDAAGATRYIAIAESIAADIAQRRA